MAKYWISDGPRKYRGKWFVTISTRDKYGYRSFLYESKGEM